MQSIICHYRALANLPITNFCEAKAAKDKYLDTYICVFKLYMDGYVYILKNRISNV